MAAEVCSPTQTLQDDSTCRFHTLSRMIIKSVFDPLLPMTPEDLTLYAKCMPLKSPITTEELSAYSEETCSKNGYIKIMLFYYFFESAKRTGLPTLQGDVIKDLLALRPLEPSVVGINEKVFDELRGKFDPNWFGYQIQLDYYPGEPAAYFDEIQKKAIRPILRLGGYLELGLEDYKEDRKRGRQKHIVLIVGEDERGIHIKNTIYKD